MSFESALHGRWSVFDEKLKRWDSYPVSEVMQIVGTAHEALGFRARRRRFRRRAGRM